MSDIVLFQFTTQEENIITDFITEIVPLSVSLLKNGVRSDHSLEVNALDIICHILNNNKGGRGNEMKFAINEVRANHGRIEILPNNMEGKSIKFLEGILNAQLEYYQQTVPQALEYVRQSGIDFTSKPLLLEEIPEIDATQEKKFHLK